MPNTIVHTKKELIEALTKTRGIVTTACDMVGISRSTYYDYYNNDTQFKEDVDSLSDLALDFAESKLMEKMDGVEMGKLDKDGEMVVYSIPPSDTALIFYLKTKGKNRGYIEKQIIESTVNDKVALLKELPPKERAKRIKELVKELKL